MIINRAFSLYVVWGYLRTLYGIVRLPPHFHSKRRVLLVSKQCEEKKNIAPRRGFAVRSLRAGQELMTVQTRHRTVHYYNIHYKRVHYCGLHYSSLIIDSNSLHFTIISVVKRLKMVLKSDLNNTSSQKIGHTHTHLYNTIFCRFI